MPILLIIAFLFILEFVLFGAMPSSSFPSWIVTTVETLMTIVGWGVCLTIIPIFTIGLIKDIVGAAKLAIEELAELQKWMKDHDPLK